MYEVDHLDRVVKLDDVPQSSVGAPLPVVVADEHRLQLAYLAQTHDPGWDGTEVRIVDASSDEPCVLVRFTQPYAWSHGPPNDEAFEGHPLAARGLQPYTAHRIDGSSWVRRLERMNSVHEYHEPETFDRLRHYVFAFHDSTFEAVAVSFDAIRVDGPLTRVVALMAEGLADG